MTSVTSPQETGDKCDITTGSGSYFLIVYHMPPSYLQVHPHMHAHTYTCTTLHYTGTHTEAHAGLDLRSYPPWCTTTVPQRVDPESIKTTHTRTHAHTHMHTHTHTHTCTRIHTHHRYTPGEGVLKELPFFDRL